MDGAFLRCSKFPEGCQEPRLPLPVAVVGIFVVAAQSCEAPLANGIGEEDLSACIHPDLEQRRAVVSRPGNKIKQVAVPCLATTSPSGQNKQISGLRGALALHGKTEWARPPLLQPSALWRVPCCPGALQGEPGPA